MEIPIQIKNYKNTRICLIIGSGSADVNGSTIFIDNILGSFKNLGCDIHLINFYKISNQIKNKSLGARNLRSRITELIFNDFYNANNIKPFDLILSFLDASVVSPDFFVDAQKITFTVNFTCNYHQFKDLHEEIAPHIGLNTYVSLPHKKKYEALGADSFWLPFAASPMVYTNNQKKVRNLSFIGTSYGIRPYYLWRLSLIHI